MGDKAGAGLFWAKMATCNPQKRMAKAKSFFMAYVLKYPVVSTRTVLIDRIYRDGGVVSKVI